MELNKNNVRKILEIIIFTVLLFVGIQNLDLVVDFLLGLFHLVFPFLLGAGIAFILNEPMSGIERGIFRRPKSKRRVSPGISRALSLLLTIIIVFGAILLVVFLIVPEIGRTFVLLSEQKIPEFIARVEERAEQLMTQYQNEYPQIASYILKLEIDWEKISQSIIDFLKNSGGSMLQSTFGIATSIVGGLVSFFVGLIFAIYILVQKEKLGRQLRKLMYAFLPEKATDKIISVCTLSAGTFAKFLSGQCIEAVILGTMFLIVMSIFSFPYALMISVLIAFTALIPVFGAFIGCFIGAFLILIVDPVKALWFIVLFLILQQIEGNLIYPHVVGGSIGLPGMWVLVAVTIGGSTMGVAGMLIFIPMTSVVYTLLREAINKRLKRNRIPPSKYLN